MTEQSKDTAGIPLPPPLIFVVPLIVGLGLNILYAIPFLPHDLTWLIGAPVILIGAALLITAVITMSRAGTSPDIDTPTRVVVTGGPYRFTRNPIYLSFALIYAGVAAGFNSPFALMLLPLAFVLIQRIVIAREEKYLERKFGTIYQQYRARVRRWL